MKEIAYAIVPQKAQSAQAHQLTLDLRLPLHGTRSKAQISSIPGAPARQRNRYQGTLGSQVLGTQLTLNEALILAKRGGR
jgi:hypothetical protein